MSFFYKNINDIFFLDSDGKLGILNKSPKYGIDISGNFYSNKLEANIFSGYNFISTGTITGKNVSANNFKTNFFQFENMSSNEIFGNSLSGKNYSGNSFNHSFQEGGNLMVKGEIFSGNNLKSNNAFTIKNNFQIENLTGIEFKINVTGNNGIRGPAEFIRTSNIPKTPSGYFSQSEFDIFISYYKSLPADKKFASGQGTGDYWFDTRVMPFFLNLGSGENNILSGYSSDRAGAMTYLPIPKTIKFLICKCPGEFETGCRESLFPTQICWNNCLINNSEDGGCLKILNTGEKMLNIFSSRPKFEGLGANENDRLNNFINYFNTGDSLLFEKKFHESYYKSPSIIFSFQTGKRDLSAVGQQIFWSESFVDKIQIHCEGTGCLKYDVSAVDGDLQDFTQGFSINSYPFFKFSYITMG